MCDKIKVGCLCTLQREVDITVVHALSVKWNDGEGFRSVRAIGTLSDKDIVIVLDTKDGFTKVLSSLGVHYVFSRHVDNSRCPC